jgi:erythromycin esterase-like protein
MKILQLTITTILLTGISFSCCNKTPNKANTKEEIVANAEKVFVDWGKKNAIAINSLLPTSDNNDLKAIAESTGDARVVAISEGFHNCKEMMQLHERLIQYLVQEKGFNTVITESGMPESRMVYDFIQGKEVTGNVYKEGFNKMYGAWKEGRSLIDWMREYNQSHDNVLRYYGADIGGFYTNWYPPVKRITDYLQKVDPAYAKQLREKLHPILKIMGTTQARVNYQEKLSAEQKAQLAIIFDETIEHLNQNEEKYVAKWNAEEYQWARQSTFAMRMAENYYRNYADRKGMEPHRYAGLNGRELMMSHNVLWALQQRKEAKIILINHVVHTKTKSQLQDGVWGNFTPMGQFIKQKLGKDFFVIGMCYGGGKFWNKWQRPAERFVDDIQEAKPDGMETTMQAIAQKNYLIDWSKAPLEAYPWLENETTLRENDYYMKMEPAEWDACFYLHEVSPGTAAN